MKYSVILLSLLGLLLAGCGHTATPNDQSDPNAALEMIDDIMEEVGEEVYQDDDEIGEDGDIDNEDHMEDDDMDDTKAMEDDDAPKVAGSSSAYTAYTDGVIGNGQEAVLFFHADWCPYCKANDARLNAFYNEGEYPISTYKIDYDTATELKAQFGVVQQDTFVKIDGEGNVISLISFPSEDELLALISS